MLRDVRRLIELAQREFLAYHREVRDAPKLFVPSDLEPIVPLLEAVRPFTTTFLDFGAGIGGVVLLADALGFEAVGIEIDDELVRRARQFATDRNSDAEFVQGSFIPDGFDWDPPDEDGLTGYDADSASDVYDRIDLDEFDCWFSYPWPGAEGLVEAIFDAHAHDCAVLISAHGLDCLVLRRHGGECLRFYGARDTDAVATFLSPR